MILSAEERSRRVQGAVGDSRKLVALYVAHGVIPKCTSYLSAKRNTVYKINLPVRLSVLLIQVSPVMHSRTITISVNVITSTFL